MPLRFQTIYLARDAATCLAFRRDSYVCSFGSDERFERESGEGGARYLEWLSARIEAYPAGHVHVVHGDAIIGQMEMRTLAEPRARGYINLFYLVEEARGRGFGSALQDYAAHFFRRARVGVAHLTVSPTNARALAHYRKHGWRDLGPTSAGDERRMRRDFA